MELQTQQMKILENKEREEVRCDTLNETMCELWRVRGLGKDITEVDNPTETQLGMMEP